MAQELTANMDIPENSLPSNKDPNLVIKDLIVRIHNSVATLNE